ncbi:D-xylose transport system permease protein [Kribbella sp. VKM Ac-2527]|uniref:Xylose transport system permease protein XylH n=1 Tax=Kribbella caucasensis TaxID=2512215 RepID=A0A4R6KMF5_9ACTN|nr:sugar ABC transporter permease [Kribbella sp. VKM Ac-2527]TDO51585.1 D-xylose transport system permease protein [Kribbella sp. VKM Ac-2527]
MTLQESSRKVPQTADDHDAPRAAGRAYSRVVAALLSRSTVLTAAALVLILYFQQVSGGLFLTSTNASLLLRQTAVVAVVAAGMAMLIIMGEIDLSVGSAAFFTGLVVAHFQVQGWGVVPSIGAGVVAGIVLGLVNGLVITRFAVPAFIVTLAGFLLWRGLGLLLAKATPIGPVSNDLIFVTEGRMPIPLVYGLGLAVLAVGARWAIAGRRGAERAGSLVALIVRLTVSVAIAVLVIVIGQTPTGLPNALLWILGVAMVLGGVLGRAKLGRRIFLLGSNAEAAVYAGINAKRTVLIGFLVMGAIYGIAGTMLTARAGVASPDAGNTLELVAIAAAVIGGTSLRGGVGSIRGAILGAFLLATMDNGMSLLGVPTYSQNVVKAIILVLAVALDGYFRRRQLAK